MQYFGAISKMTEWSLFVSKANNWLSQLLFSYSVMSDSAIPWASACQASLSFTISQSLLKLMSLESVMPSNSILLCHFLLLPSTFSSIKLFPVSWLFTSGDQSTGASASASVLPVNIQDWFPFGLTDLISLKSKGLWRVFSNTTVQKHQFFGSQKVQLSHLYITTGKTTALTRRTFVSKVMFLLFNKIKFQYNQIIII